ncbi:MAG: hypothetical protein G01um10142_557 [Parcubacteria group bacterium Gr01-1014_2]|nr:MAG: hypothetical protein G01um10142_557 [Parcubacteria group bacterium Gr01-1014_2]
MRILFFGIYRPEYSRNRVLIKGLKQNGIEVLECRSSSKGFLAFFELFFKHLKFRGKYDFMLVGFPGQEVMFLARFLTLLSFSGQARKPIIFDAFTSHFGGYILDRQYYSLQSFRSKYYRFLDKWSCKLADLVLLDTNTHIDFFVREFGLSRKKFRRIFVGTDSDIFYPRNVKKSDDKFLVHFHGHYIPLQGVRYIIKAAKILENQNIFFNLIGRGQTFKNDKKLAEDLKLTKINFIDSVPYEKLADYIAKSDVCFGIFGDTPKADLVIPNKVFEALAAGKPVITSDSNAIRELLTDGENVILCKAADAGDLANKIIKLRDDLELRLKVGRNGGNIFISNAAPEILGRQLLNYIQERF